MNAASWESIASTDGASFDTYVAHPKNSNGHAIVLLHEIFGVNACIRDMAHWMADQGWLVAAPDLYWRLKPHVELGPSQPPYLYDENATSAARSYLGRFDEGLAINDIAATVHNIRDKSAEIMAVHLLGVCLGGKMAVLGAQDKNVTSAISCYGVGIEKSLEALSTAQCPLQLHFGGRDKIVPNTAVDIIADAATGHDIELFIYPDATHGFFSNGRTTYDPSAASMAWVRAKDLMQRTVPYRT